MASGVDGDGVSAEGEDEEEEEQLAFGFVDSLSSDGDPSATICEPGSTAGVVSSSSHALRPVSAQVSRSLFIFATIRLLTQPLISFYDRTSRRPSRS